MSPSYQLVINYEEMINGLQRTDVADFQVKQSSSFGLKFRLCHGFGMKKSLKRLHTSVLKESADELLSGAFSLVKIISALNSIDCRRRKGERKSSLPWGF